MEFKKVNETPEVEDTTPPPPPYLEALPKATKNSQIEIKGSTEPGVTVILNVNSEVYEVISDKQGQFSHTVTLDKEENIVYAFAKDASGNVSQKTNFYKIIYDNKPPTIEITKPRDGEEFFGSRQRQLVLEGATEKGASIEINGRFVLVDDDGNFSFVTTLSEGENKFLIKAKDEAENVTEKTISVRFTP